jgi:hypothetical protein
MPCIQCDLEHDYDVLCSEAVEDAIADAEEHIYQLLALRARLIAVEQNVSVEMCEACGTYPADAPSKLCVGCNDYKEHTGY